MKKIMFNDRYGLTQAVIELRKTMTRRIIPLTDTDKTYLDTAFDWDLRERVIIDRYAKYKPGEVVAVAQPYKDLELSYIPHIDEPDFKTITKHAPKWGNPKRMKGWSNKMFVRADIMPHQIRITNIKIERLQDISEEDCLKEGIQEVYPYIDRNPEDKVRTFQYFKDGKIRHRISPAPVCFSYLINDVEGKGTWESNPYVFAYSFKLIK